MIRHHAYFLRASYTLIFATACLLTACAPEGDDASIYHPPGDGGLVQDASLVVASDAATTTPQPPPQTATDAGPTVALDAGTTAPLMMSDSSTVIAASDAGPVTTGGDGGAAPDASAGTRPDQGTGDGKDVITIGDSWMNLDDSVGIQESLEKISKRDYRNFGVPGTLLLQDGLLGKAIPTQYDSAKAGGPIKTVIMTAGGNDILQDAELGPLNLFGTPGCIDSAFTDACKSRIDEVAAGLQMLWTKMAADGVQDVLIVGYTNTALGGDYKKVSAYSNSKINPICAGVPAPLRCSTLDTDMAVPGIMLRDNIHPVDADYDRIGKAVWDLMQALGMRR